MKVVFAAIIILAATMPGAAADVFSRPFGLSMGQKIQTLDHPKRKGTDVAIRSVPRPHPLLSIYSVVATDEAGVCEIAGYAPASNNGERKTREMVRHLTEMFGEPKWLPGNRDPNCTGIWFWSRYGSDKGDVERVAVHQYEFGRKTAAMMTFEFKNRKDCEPKPTPNPFKKRPNP